MKYKVFLTPEAENDIFQIYFFILENDSEQNADYVFDKLKKTCLNPNTLPDRSQIPPELARIHISNYKEIHFKPYRIIYQLIEKKIYIHCLFDGRRELQEILENRLLR